MMGLDILAVGLCIVCQLRFQLDNIDNERSKIGLSAQHMLSRTLIRTAPIMRGEPLNWELHPRLVLLPFSD